MEIIKTSEIQQEKGIAGAIQQAVRMLEEGRLVVFPTETVYGIAAAVQYKDSLRAILKAKQRPCNKPFTLHIADKSQLDIYAPGLSLRHKIFLRKAWPGPLTAVIRLSPRQMAAVRKKLGDELVESLYYNDSIGIRLPDHPVARRILESTKMPVVATSANISGKEPAVSAEQLIEQQNADGNNIRENVYLMLDDGPTRYQKSSTVVAFEGWEYSILRSGVLDKGTLERMMKVTILFVCTGNTCRSPMAEGIFRDMVAKKTGCTVDQLAVKGYKVLSAGVMACDGVPATPEAVAVCKELGVDITGHRARLLGAETVKQADIIFTMSKMHYDTVIRMVPQVKESCFLLAGDRDIADPIGANIDGYRDCAGEIVQSLEEQMQRLF